MTNEELRMTNEESGLRRQIASPQQKSKGGGSDLGGYVLRIRLLNQAQLQRCSHAFAADDGEVGSGRDEIPGLVAQVPGPGRLSHA